MKEITLLIILYGIFPILFSLIFKVNIKAIRPFLLVVFFSSLYEFFGTFIFELNSKYWFICYKILAFCSLHYFFYKLLNSDYKIIFVLFVTFFLTILFYSLFEWDQLNYLDVNSYFNTLQTIIVLVFSILWIVRFFSKLEIASFTQSPFFYFISGLILYYSGTIFLFLLSSYIFKNDKANFQSYWMLNIIFNLVLRTLLIVGIWNGRVK
jgi:hypothetical protein